MIQAIDQIWLGAASQFWRIIGHIAPSTPQFEAMFEEITRSLTTLDYVISEDLEQHLGHYRQSSQGRHNKLVLIGHSQGNLYASRAYAQLTAEPPVLTRNDLRVIAVATPESSVAGESGPLATLPYTTLREDFISDVLFVTVNPRRLVPNIHNDQFPGCLSASLCHEFIDSYLYGNVSGARIADQLSAAITALSAGLPPPPNQPPTAGFTMTSIPLAPVPNGQTLNLTVPLGGSVEVHLNASLSTDPDGSVTAWQWTVNGTQVATTASFSRSFTTGSYIISLFVTDNQGAASQTATGTVSVTESVPPLVPTSYALTDLGVLPNGTFSIATAINNRGVIVGHGDSTASPGYSDCGGPRPSSPFIWTALTGMKFLDALPPVDYSGNGSIVMPCDGIARGINDDGVVVGHLRFGTGISRPFVWVSGDGMQVIPDGNGGANAVNNSGLAVGGASSVAFRWSSTGGFQSLGITLQSSWAYDVNELNQIVGHSQIEFCNSYPVMWNNAGQPQGISLDGLTETLPPHQYLCGNHATGVNNMGGVVGSATAVTSNGTYPIGWISKDGAAQSVGELPGFEGTGTTALGVNDNEVVVGQSKGRAFVWTRGSGIRDLNSLLDTSGAGWTLVSANAINAIGQIVGYGSHNGETRAFLLNLVQPPSGVLFEDHFNRPNSALLGPPWIEYLELTSDTVIQGINVDPGYIELNSNALTVHYTESGRPGSVNAHPYAYAPLNGTVSSYPDNLGAASSAATGTAKVRAFGYRKRT
ncbi:MAG: hypothetical protein IT282_06810 [Bacteroidetes bacterium]|nr:hypothetical protein [Bacteroidota bacterium]